MASRKVSPLTHAAGHASAPAPWIGTSWKMHKTRAEAQRYVMELAHWAAHTRAEATVFVLPPYTALDSVTAVLADKRIKVGAQNMHWAEAGAHTGEVSAAMLKDVGAEIVELGHFERRQEFAETDFTINKKVHAALNYGLRPLVCVGETDRERDFDVAGEVVARQVKIALHGVPRDAFDLIAVAYEPGWAIGKEGHTADPRYVADLHRRIRSAIAEQHGKQSAPQTRILYGGSVTSRNAATFARQREIEGLFVGRAASDISSFIEIIEAFCDTRRRESAGSDACSHASPRS